MVAQTLSPRLNHCSSVFPIKLSLRVSLHRRVLVTNGRKSGSSSLSFVLMRVERGLPNSAMTAV